MTIMGSTGPVLVFESILNTFSKYFAFKTLQKFKLIIMKNFKRHYDIDYMGFRCWIGLWVCFFLLVITVTDLSFLVKYITRFTGIFFFSIIIIIINSSSLKI